MVDIDKAKSQKPNVELVSAEKLKSMVNQIEVDPSYIELRLCDPFYENVTLKRPVLNICEPVWERIIICEPSHPIGKPDLGDIVINPPNSLAIKSSEELISAVKALTTEVQELKKKIGKN